MNITVELIKDEAKKKEWNQSVNHPLQTWEWGEIKQQSGNEVLKLAEVNEKGEIEKGYLFTVHSLPFGRLVINYARGFYPSPAILKHIVEKFQRKKLVFIKLEPDCFIEEAGKFQIPLLLKKWRKDKLLFSLSTFTLFAPHTFFIDLDNSEAELLALCKSKTRYNIRLAQKKGVSVSELTTEKAAFETFYSLYEQTVSRQNYLGHDKAYHRRVWETFSKAKMAQIYVASFEKTPLSAYEIINFKNRAYYLYGGSSVEYKEVMASNLLMWEVIKSVQKKGFTEFDMWGALPQNYNRHDAWAGFHRFKEGYGGEHKTYLPTIDVVVNPLEYKIVSFLWPLRIKLLTLLRKIKKVKLPNG
jgi:lipid II:glycine glycyltransferase (peptidoglycan interpeptide bridge formation enzyme)